MAKRSHVWAVTGAVVLVACGGRGADDPAMGEELDDAADVTSGGRATETGESGTPSNGGGSDESGDAVDPRTLEILELVGDPMEGELVYVLNCSNNCHLPDGTGVTNGGLGKDLTGWLERNEDEKLVGAILDGVPPMPAYRDYLSDQEIADVVAYLRVTFDPGG